MDTEQFKSRIKELLETEPIMPFYTAGAELRDHEVIENLRHCETASDLLDELHRHMRAYLTKMHARLVTLIGEAFTPEQLQAHHIYYNPAGSLRVPLDAPHPVILKNDSQELTILSAPKQLQIYGAADSPITLRRCNAYISGQSFVDCEDCAQVIARDFAQLFASGTTRATLYDYAQCDCYDRSKVDANDYASVTLHAHTQAKVTRNVSLTKIGPGSEVACQTGHQLVNVLDFDRYLILKTGLGSPSYLTRLASTYERQAFATLLGHKPYQEDIVTPEPDHDTYNLSTVRSFFGGIVQAFDSSLARRIGSATTKKELLTLCLPQLDRIMHAINDSTLLPLVFDADQLAEHQVYVNDRIAPPSRIKGDFYLFGHQRFTQPPGTIGHYHDHTVGFVEYGTALFFNQTIGFAEHAKVWAVNDSCVYATDCQVRAHGGALASVHGSSQAYAKSGARVYGYDTSQLIGQERGILIQYDAATVSGRGAVAYADPHAVAPDHALTLRVDPTIVAQVRKSGREPDYDRKSDNRLRY